MTQKRYQFHCWHCHQDYSFLCELSTAMKFITWCPYCEKQGVVDLRPYRTPALQVYKTVTVSQPSWEDFEFPVVMPTAQPQE